jgi:hypothetical protein
MIGFRGQINMDGFKLSFKGNMGALPLKEK